MIERKSKGERLAAAEVNELSVRVNALEQMTGGKGVKVRSVPGSGISLQGTSVWRLPPEAALELTAVNVGDSDLPAYSPAGIAGHFYEDASKLRYKRALSIRVPEDGDEGRFVVTAEPIGAGKAGRVWVSGVFPVRIQNDEDETPQRVDIALGETFLVADEQGSCQVLFEENANAIHIALVRFTGTSASSIERVKVCDLSGSIAKVGLQTIDGVPVFLGDRVLLRDGVWEVSPDQWVSKGKPDLVLVLRGTSRSETAILRIDDITGVLYRGLGAYFK